jgi:hypothetical protein
MKPTKMKPERLVVIVLLMIVASCSKPEFDFNNLQTDDLETQWGLPLVQSKLTLADFIKDTTGTIHTGPDSAITLIYESHELLSQEAEERTKIKDITDSENATFSIPGGEIIPPGISGSAPVVFSFEIELTEPGQHIDNLTMKGGTYNLILRTNINKSVASIHLDIPSFIKKGTTNEVLNCDFNLNNVEGGELIRQATFDLSQYNLHILPDSFGNDTTNTVFIYGTVFFITDANPNLSPYYVNLENDLTNLTYSFFSGYIGKRDESYTDTIDLGIYNSADFGAILFGDESVRMKIHVENELGLPLEIIVEQLTAYHTQDNSNNSIDINLFGPDSANIFPINSPTINQIGEKVVTDIQSVPGNNIVQALNIAPNKLVMKLVGVFNPESNPNIDNFFYNTSLININVALELELYGRIDAFRIADTLDFSLENDDHLNGLEFNAIITNGFPIDGKAQVLFTDDDYNVLYSLFPDDESIIVSGVTGPPPNSRVESPSTKETRIIVDSDDIEMILGATKLIFRTTLNTEPGKMVRIYSDYNVDLALSAKFYINY